MSFSLFGGFKGYAETKWRRINEKTFRTYCIAINYYHL